MSTQTPDELVTVRQAAKKCGRNPETIRRWIWSGKLPAEKLGNQLFVRRRALERFAHEATVTPPDHTTPLSQESSESVEGEFAERIGAQQVESSGSVDAQAKADVNAAKRGPGPGARAHTISEMRLLREEIRSLVGNLDRELADEDLRRNRSK